MSYVFVACLTVNAHIFLDEPLNCPYQERLQKEDRQEESVPMDGNCFFEAVCRQVPETTASRLRQLVCDYLHENSEQFIELVQDPDTGATSSDIYSSQLTDLRTPGVWALNIGDLVVAAASSVLSRTIAVVSKTGFMQVYPEGEKINDETIMIVHEGGHYNTTIKVAEKHKWSRQPMHYKQPEESLSPAWAEVQSKYLRMEQEKRGRYIVGKLR